MSFHFLRFLFFFFKYTATTEIYTLSLHDALPIYHHVAAEHHLAHRLAVGGDAPHGRSEEHTSELQSPCNLVRRLLLEKKHKIRRPEGSHTPHSRPHPRSLRRAPS